MRTILNFAVAAVLASCCLEALGSGPDKTQPPTSVGSKGPIASVELIRKASIKDESAKPSAPLKGPDWIEMDRKAISGEFLLTSRTTSSPYSLESRPKMKEILRFTKSL